MDTVTIDGIEYVRAAVLARQHNYTADYIGQLCRGNKVDAHLVGRTWYVYPPSLDSHKSTRYAELRFGDKSQNEDLKTTSSRRSVIAPPAKNTSKGMTKNFSHRVFWRDQDYREDDADLLPPLNKVAQRTQTTEMKVNLADSHRVSIVGRSDKVTMVTEPAPAIALAGTLKVQSYEPRFVDISDVAESDESVENTRQVETGPMKIDQVEGGSGEPSDDKLPVTRLADKTQFPVYDVPLKRQAIDHAPLSFTPKPVLAKKRTAIGVREDEKTIAVKKPTPSEVVASDSSHSIFFNLVVAPAVVILVVMVAGSFFFLESSTEVNARGEQVGVINLTATIFDSFWWR